MATKSIYCTNEEDDDVNDYTKSVRRALNACQRDISNFEPLKREPLIAANIGGSSKNEDRPERDTIPVLEYKDITPTSFLRDYIQPNRPCRIRNPPSFARVSENWSTPSSARTWFRRVMKSTPVPVRRQAETEKLDEDGRAKECETIMMNMEDWIAHLDENASGQLLYLKDWHLQSFLETHHPQHIPLYQVPDIFPPDLLNGFLNEYNIGDYRFVYWGPQGSSTAWHSDVMNSYSWSYNVYGTKQWVFEGTAMPCIQRAGELMFVPSKLQHRVVNLEETLSINHNWVTAWNLSFVWDCVKSEIAAIDKELEAWGIDAFDARENMLRGCLGLDVTSFVFMIVWCGLKSKDSCEKDCLRNEMARVLDDEGRLPIHLEQRLTAILSDTTMASNAIVIIRSFIS